MWKKAVFVLNWAAFIPNGPELKNLLPSEIEQLATDFKLGTDMLSIKNKSSTSWLVLGTFCATHSKINGENKMKKINDFIFQNFNWNYGNFFGIWSPFFFIRNLFFPIFLIVGVIFQINCKQNGIRYDTQDFVFLEFFFIENKFYLPTHHHSRNQS